MLDSGSKTYLVAIICLDVSKGLGRIGFQLWKIFKTYVKNTPQFDDFKQIHKKFHDQDDEKKRRHWQQLSCAFRKTFKCISQKHSRLESDRSQHTFHWIVQSSVNILCATFRLCRKYPPIMYHGWTNEQLPIRKRKPPSFFWFQTSNFNVTNNPRCCCCNQILAAAISAAMKSIPNIWAIYNLLIAKYTVPFSSRHVCAHNRQ